MQDEQGIRCICRVIRTPSCTMLQHSQDAKIRNIQAAKK